MARKIDYIPLFKTFAQKRYQKMEGSRSEIYTQQYKKATALKNST